VVSKTTKTKIAIACQSGGSQTAFTAGVLSAFFEKKIHLEKRIVGLSGTSGGAELQESNFFQPTSAIKHNEIAAKPGPIA
jgi:predicted patatin/cPLA2 family phospholipase